jgi:hypothetical protein
MQDIQKRIDDADRELKEKAKNALKKISDNYQKTLTEKILEELELARQDFLQGNINGADQHKLRAEIYKSALDSAKKMGD